MADDLTPIEQFALVLLRHSAFEEFGRLRSWKGYDWEIMNRLHEKGLISDPMSKARSVVFTDVGQRQAEALVAALIGARDSGASAADPLCDCGCRAVKQVRMP